MTRPDPSRGVFETLMVRDGRVQALSAHLDRLAASVSELYRAPLPARLGDDVLSAARSLTGALRMRIDVVPAAGVPHVTVSTAALSPPRSSAAVVAPVTIGGGLGPHKWRDRRHLDALAERAGPNRVALICDHDGQVLEAAWANVWLLDGDSLRTPAVDGRILPGVTRARLWSLAPSLGLYPTEAPIALTDLQRASAVFLTSSLRVLATTTSSRPPGPVSPLIAAIAQALAAGDWS